MQNDFVELELPGQTKPKQVTSPTPKLPAELLERIFQYAVTPLSTNECWRGPNGAPGVFRATRYGIMATCRLWRHIAIMTKGLWSTITIEFTPDTPLREPYRLYPSIRLLRLEFERSGNRLLTLQLRGLTKWMRKWGGCRRADTTCATSL